MAKKPSIFSRIRLVYKPSSMAAKAVMLVAITVTTAALLIMGGYIRDAQARTDKARDDAAGWEQANDDLNDKIDDLGSIDSIKDIARDELDMVDPDTVIITPKD